MKCKLLMPISALQSETEWKMQSKNLLDWIQIKKDLKNIKAKKIMSQIIKATAKLVEEYESKKYNFEKAQHLEVLNSFISEFQLKQRDLAIYFGSQSIVSDVIKGKRRISIEAAKKLGNRFSVSPTLFLDL